MLLHTLRGKLLGMSVTGILLTAGVLVAVGADQSADFSARAQKDVDALSSDQLDGTAHSAARLVASQTESVSLAVSAGMRVATTLLARGGGVTLSPESVTWYVSEGNSAQQAVVRVPKLLVDGTWLGQQGDARTAVPVIDEVKKLVGAEVTVYQRINDGGDMLAVASSLFKNPDERLTGQVARVKKSDGSTDVALAEIALGKPYTGNAYLSGAWYASSYKPLRDKSGEVIGMMHVGVRQELVSALRSAIVATKVGDKGFVEVLGGLGASRGRVLISADKTGEGRDATVEKDALGRAYFAEIVESARRLAPGDLATTRYVHPKTREPMITRVAYNRQWDWVIVVHVPEAQSQAAAMNLQDGRRTMTRSLLLVAMVIALVGGCLSWLVARSIADDAGRRGARGRQHERRGHAPRRGRGGGARGRVPRDDGLPAGHGGGCRQDRRRRPRGADRAQERRRSARSCIRRDAADTAVTGSRHEGCRRQAERFLAASRRAERHARDERRAVVATRECGLRGQRGDEGEHQRDRPQRGPRRLDRTGRHARVGRGRRLDAATGVRERRDH
jgi:hypothetical protein